MELPPIAKVWLMLHYKDLFRSDFVKNIFTLSSGTIIAQGLSLVGTPFVTRIYTPGVLGDFSLIISSASITGVFVCLGLMTSIMLPKEDEESRGLCQLISISLIFTTTIIMIAFLAVSESWKAFNINLPYPLGCLLMYLYVIFTNIGYICYAYANRQRLYRVLFWNPILATVLNLSIGIVLGLLGFGLLGYALGNIIAQIVIDIFMLCYANPYIRVCHKEYKPIVLLRKYSDFPKYQLPANFISTISQQIPVQMISRYFGSAILGLYSMTIRVMQLPIALIATPVNRIYYKEAVHRYNAGEDIGEFSFKLIRSNIKIAIIPITLLSVFGEPLFSFVFGSKWAEAGNYAAILGLYELFFFCANCLSGNFVIIGKQKINLVFSIVSIVLNSGAFILGTNLLGRNIYMLLTIFVAMNILYFMLTQGLFLYLTGIRILDYLKFTFIYIFIPMSIALILRVGLYYFGIL